MRLRSLALLPALVLVLTGCRQPTPTGEEAFDTPPDTAAVADPVYDPEGFAGGWETRARTVILEDEAVREAQVVLINDTVQVTAALGAGPQGQLPEGEVLRLKAQQFVLAAMREVEQTGVTPGTDMLAPTQRAYAVIIRGPDGEQLFEGVKPPQASELQEVNRTPGAGQG